MGNQNSIKTYTDQTIPRSDRIDLSTQRATQNPPGQSTDQSATLFKEGMVRPDGTSITISGNILSANSINVPAFSVYGTALVSATTATQTKIPYNIVEFDHAGAFDKVNNRYYAPVKGIYQINAIITSASNATGLVWLSLYKNGAAFKFGPATPNSSVAPNVGGSWTVELGVREYIEIFGYQTSGGALNLGSNASTYAFSGFLIKQTA